MSCLNREVAIILYFSTLDSIIYKQINKQISIEIASLTMTTNPPKSKSKLKKQATIGWIAKPKNDTINDENR